MTDVATIIGLLSGIASGDPVARSAAQDYAMEFLGANTPEEAIGCLLDTAARLNVRIYRNPWEGKVFAFHATRTQSGKHASGGA